jgi:threonine/homoserine/homoserine lactone efflux protein
VFPCFLLPLCSPVFCSPVFVDRSAAASPSPDRIRAIHLIFPGSRQVLVGAGARRRPPHASIREVHAFALFLGVAVVVTLTPGPATAMVIRSALRGGRLAALGSTLGNSIGVMLWGFASAVGISALVAASEVAFVALKVGGAVVLAWLGLQSFRRSRRAAEAPHERRGPLLTPRVAFRGGIVTSLANPKLAVFFVALFPQFMPRGDAALPTALAMAGLIVGLDLIWFSVLALAVTRARERLAASRWPARMERMTGSVMIGLGLRLALESR